MFFCNSEIITSKSLSHSHAFTFFRKFVNNKMHVNMKSTISFISNSKNSMAVKDGNYFRGSLSCEIK